MNASFIQNLINFAPNINVKLPNFATPLGGGRNFKWNSPVILLFCLVMFFVHLGYQTEFRGAINSIFSVPTNFKWSNPTHYLSLVLYIFEDGGTWRNISTSMLLVVVVGPIIEARIGSIQLVSVIFFTAVFNGLIDVLLFRGGLYGPLCVAYLLMFLGTFVNIKKGDIPLSFVLMLIIVLFVGADQWTENFGRQFPMIIGSLMGIVMAKFVNPIQTDASQVPSL